MVPGRGGPVGDDVAAGRWCRPAAVRVSPCVLVVGSRGWDAAELGGLALRGNDFDHQLPLILANMCDAPNVSWSGLSACRPCRSLTSNRDRLLRDRIAVSPELEHRREKGAGRSIRTETASIATETFSIDREGQVSNHHLVRCISFSAADHLDHCRSLRRNLSTRIELRR